MSNVEAPEPCPICLDLCGMMLMGAGLAMSQVPPDDKEAFLEKLATDTTDLAERVHKKLSEKANS